MSIQCDLEENCWNNSCNKQECDNFIINDKYSNCWALYKHFIEKPHTLEEIGKILNVSHATIKKIEENALNKIKKSNCLNIKEIKKHLKNI